jgi:hypothetical protein
MPRLDGAASCLEVVSSNQYAFESNQRRETSHLDLSSNSGKNLVLVFHQDRRAENLGTSLFIKKPGVFSLRFEKGV